MRVKVAVGGTLVFVFTLVAVAVEVCVAVDVNVRVAVLVGVRVGVLVGVRVGVRVAVAPITGVDVLGAGYGLTHGVSVKSGGGG